MVTLGWARYRCAREFLSCLPSLAETAAAVRGAPGRCQRLQRLLGHRSREPVAGADGEDVLSQDGLGPRGELSPSVEGTRLPKLFEVSESIRRILEERAFNARIEEWIDGLKGRARIRRYVW
jgi:hypothetical protein